MILQVNQRGSWQNVVEFDPQLLPRVQLAVLPLARAIMRQDYVEGRGESATTWRVVAARAKSPKVIAYLEGPAFNWRKR